GLPDGGLSTVQYLQRRRAGVPPLVVTVASTDSSVADLITTAQSSDTVTVEIQPGQYYSPGTIEGGGVGLRGLSSGQTFVSVNVPGFIQVGDATQVVNITNHNIGFLGVPAAVGAGLQSGIVTARLGETEHGGVGVHIASGDTAIALVSSAPDAAGTPSVNISVLNGQTDAFFYVHGVDDTTGTVLITADATGFESGVDTIDIVTPALQIASLPDTADVAEPDVDFLVQIGISDASGSSLVEFQPIRAGGNAQTVTLISSDGSIGELVTLSATDDTVEVSLPVGGFETAGAVASGGVAFHPVFNGVTAVSAQIPGFLTTDAGSVTVQVIGDLTGINDDVPPADLVLEQNIPNPFNPVTTIRFSLPSPSRVRLVVYDVKGRHIATLIDERLPAGQRRVAWNGRDSRGNPVSSGVYFYRLKTEDKTLSRKMVLLR
ncbi:MAG: T9SS type A sorting domain-containing protein, partial [Candidatus Latescibacterota bacterium]